MASRRGNQAYYAPPKEGPSRDRFPQPLGLKTTMEPPVKGTFSRNDPSMPFVANSFHMTTDTRKMALGNSNLDMVGPLQGSQPSQIPEWTSSEGDPWSSEHTRDQSGNTCLQPCDPANVEEGSYYRQWTSSLRKTQSDHASLKSNPRCSNYTDSGYSSIKPPSSATFDQAGDSLPDQRKPSWTSGRNAFSETGDFQVLDREEARSMPDHVPGSGPLLLLSFPCSHCPQLLKNGSELKFVDDLGPVTEQD